MVYEEMNTDYAKAKIVIGSFEFLSDEYSIESIEIRTGAYDGNAVGIGCVYTPTCTITMQNIDEIKKGIKFELYFLIKDNWKNFGRFWVNKSPSRNKEVMTIEAHGALEQIGSRPLYAPGMFCIENQNTIRRLVAFSEVMGIHEVNFYPGQKIDDFLDRKITVPVKGDEATFIDVELGVLPNNPTKENGFFVFPGEKEYAEKNGISVKDFLAGIAILFGGNITEKEGEVWCYSLTGQDPYVIFKTSMCSDDFLISNETYDLDYTKLNFIHTESLDFVSRTTAEVFHFPLYCGTNKEGFVWFGWEGSQESDVAYVQNVECDWVGYSAGEMYDNENYAFIDGDFLYKTGKFSFPGYNQRLYAGNIILIEDEENRKIPFFIGEVILKWDGGFTTDISCNCNADASGIFNSSTQSGISSSANMMAAAQTQNTVSFATISFSNVKDSTISGSKFIDGTITGSKIEESTITGSLIANNTLTGNLIKDGTITNNLIQDSTLTGAKIVDATIGFEKVDTSFITKLTADSAYIDNLTAKVANINTLKADDAIIKNIQTVAISADYIRAITADIGYLTTSEADIKYANITLGNIDTANIDKANIGLLFNEVGLIDRATIVDGHITGFLDAVEINANKITAGTLIAERLLLKGSEDGLLFALNNMGELVSQNVDTLDGGVLTERTVTADKLVAKSITANELDVANVFSDKAVINKIFAQDITATGTITGAKLYGAYAEIDSGKLGGLEVSSEGGLVFSSGDLKFRIGTQSHGYGAVIFKNSPTDFTQAQYVDNGIYLRDSIDGGWDVIITPSDTHIGALEVTKDKVSGKEFISSNNYGFAGLASDIEGGRIQLKGSGNWYEIDAAGGTLRFIDGSQGKEIALMNSNAFYPKGELVISNNKSIRFGTPTSDYMIKGTETTITIGDKDTGGNSGYVYLQGDTKILTGSLDAPKIKEGGDLLKEKYCYYQEGTGSVPGGSGWMGVTVTFPKPYLKKPFVMVVQNTATATENIWIQGVNEKAVSFKVYAPTEGWTFSYRWMAIGVKA